MKKTIKKLLGLGCAVFMAAAAISSAARADTIDFNHPAYAAVGHTPTSVPIGYIEFCRSHREDCTMNANVVEAQALTEQRWAQLLQVNTTVNTDVIPMTDDELYNVNEFWTYPRGFGDCEDYVLAKRKALISAGWAPSTLLITVVRQENGEGHAVLLVRTDRGDLVLDNQANAIKLWNDTPYQFLKRQSQFDSAQWVDILDDRSTIVASR